VDIHEEGSLAEVATVSLLALSGTAVVDNTQVALPYRVVVVVVVEVHPSVADTCIVVVAVVAVFVVAVVVAVRRKLAETLD